MNEIVTIIMELREQFILKYHVPPKYIKIPDWVLDVFIEERNKIFSSDQKTDIPILTMRYIMGLQVCPTVSAQTLEDIEVF